MREQSRTNTVVVGAGQAGLAVSHLLLENDIAHVVLERGRVGHSWRTQRWDSFCLNTPNSVNRLPGAAHAGSEPDKFCSRDELVQYLEAYAERLPVKEGVTVSAVRRADTGFEVVSSAGQYRCSNVVLCSGDQNHPRVPAVAAALPDDLAQLHAGDYRRPDQLPDGAVLVVGAGQSGVQIVEDLLEAGRDVYLCTSAVGRGARRYRGKDIVEWSLLSGLAEQPPEALEDPREMYAAQPQVSGTNGGHSVSLHLVGRNGAKLLGRLDGAQGRVLKISGDLLANVAAGDDKVKGFCQALDTAIEKMGLDVPPAEIDPADVPFDGMADMAAIRRVDLDEAKIRSVVWATGFGPKFDYLDPFWLDDRGRPRHTKGICDVPGLYCVGFMWLRRRISGLLAGVADDATHVVGQIVTRGAA